MRILGLIPARLGSRGIPRKNVRVLAGKPLLQYAIDCAKRSGAIDEVFVSTESAEVQELAVRLGARAPFLRPVALATDDAPTLPVVLHAIRHIGEEFDAVALLQPTSPLRTPGHIDQAARMLCADERADSVVSVTEIPEMYAPDLSLVVVEGGLKFVRSEGASLRRQDARRAFVRDGTIYLTRTATIKGTKSLYGVRSLPLILPARESLNLDSIEDWRRAERILKQ